MDGHILKHNPAQNSNIKTKQITIKHLQSLQQPNKKHPQPINIRNRPLTRLRFKTTTYN